MKFDEILEVIKGLANSQGFYGRLLRSIQEIEEESPEDFDNLVKELEAQNFQEPLDVVLYFET